MRYTKRLKTDDLLSPEISVAIVYFVFLFFAFISFKIANTREFLLIPRGYFANAPSFLAYVISLLGVAVLFFSVKIGRKLAVAQAVAFATPVVLACVFATASLALYLTFPLPVLAIFTISGSYTFLLWFISKRLHDVDFLISISLVLAFFFSFLTLLGGAPILSAASRQAAAIAPARALFHGFAVFSAVLLIAFYEKRKATATIFLLAILAALSGFKSDATAILVSAGIAGLLLKRISAKELLLGLTGVIFLLTAVSTYIAGISYGAWKVAPHLYIFYRTGLTFSVFDRVVQLSFPFGYLHGSTLLSTTQEIVSTAVLGYKEPHIITSTLLGPGMLDFGVFGVVLTCASLGIYLGMMHDLRDAMRTCLYAIALTHTFILIEVGVQLSSIIFYLSLLYLALSCGKPRPAIVSVELQKIKTTADS
ncbi:MAG: hypothetical protein HY930_05265 [Euryarchaeota archaeon]|nr:hypothetical protein [Euryarchaeota archaeon]